MFHTCENLENLDLSKFKTEKVTNMSIMFYNCIKLEKIIFSDLFDTKNVTDMKGIFNNCEK